MKKLLIGAIAGLFTVAAMAVTVGDGSGVAIQTREFSLNNDSITMTHAAATTNAYGSLTLGNLPEGLIVIHGAVLDISGVIAGVGTNTSTVSASVGTVAATSASLTGTVANIIASSSATGWTNRSTKIGGVSTAAVVRDGTATAPALYLNVAVPVSLTNGTLSAGGKVRVTFSNVGDK
jgi:hypothetical protein